MIKLKDYQENAVKKALGVKNCLWLMGAGTGKTFPSIFLSKILTKNKHIDKTVIAVTPSAAISYVNTYTRKLNYNVRFIENKDKEEDKTLLEKNIQEFKDWFESDEKVVIIKHSLLEELGLVEEHLKYLENSLKKNYRKILIVVDEAHELNNPDSLGHQSFRNLSFVWDRVLLMTATPFSSTVMQLYGLVCLIYPKLWKSKHIFKRLHIVEEIINDWKGKYLRTDIVECINLPLLRKTIEPFTYFYYPKLDITFHLHYTKLEDYSAYDDICSGKVEKEAKKKKERSK